MPVKEKETEEFHPGEITSGIRRVLSIPFVYSTVQDVLGAELVRKEFIGRYVQPKKDERILDVGCGPADILKHIPSDVVYTGIDRNKAYIESAKKSYGNRHQFLVADVRHLSSQEYEPFDIVIASGLLHHLNDEEVLQLLDDVHDVLAINGRFITIDPAITMEQNSIARFFISRDRGQFVRTPEAYQRLLRRIFSRVEVNVRTDLLRVPYTHAIVESRGN